MLWPGGAVAVCDTEKDQSSFAVVPDGAGGAIVAWQDNRAGLGYDIYAQKDLGRWRGPWTRNGVALCTATGAQRTPTIVSDGAGGAIVIWSDERPVTTADLYAQRISADGTVQWAADGVPLCRSTGTMSPRAVPDGAGGAIVTWEDYRNHSENVDIYARRISGDGVAQWTDNGVSLCSATGPQRFPTIVPDDAGGAIAIWNDQRSGDLWHMYAQRISGAGTPQWQTDGVVLSAGGEATGDILIPDGAGGAIAAWTSIGDLGAHIYAQRVSADGAVQWEVGGAPVCTAIPGGQGVPVIASDGAHGAIIAWHDYRNGTGNLDIFAQNINADGTLGDLATPALLSLASADVTADGVKLTWFAGGSGCASATVYRSLGGDTWTRIGEVVADGTGYLRYVDHVGAPATRVGYRLGIVDRDIESFHGETWVDLPSLELALRPVRPNPTQRGTLTVNFTLPSAAPTRIELLDVSGRRVVEREVGSLGAGYHALDLREGRRLAPGLYLVRLHAGCKRAGDAGGGAGLTGSYLESGRRWPDRRPPQQGGRRLSGAGGS